MFAQFCILPLRSKSDPPGYSPEIVYNSSTYSILAIAITIWIIASLIQLWSISFKHPKRWLIFNVLTFGVSLIFMIWPHIHTSTTSEPSLLGNAIGLFLYWFPKHGLTGLGLHFSGMGIRKQSDDRDLRLE